MTKDEILNKHLNMDVQNSKYPNGYPYIGEAMEEYGKQMALAFFEFERGVPPEQMESNYDYFLSKYQQEK